MSLPELSNQITKIISLTLLTITIIIKLMCLLIIKGQLTSPCIAGWHINEELSNYIFLLGTGLIPDILMLICVGVAMAFKNSNFGADPGSIIYNFLVGLTTFSCIFTFFGIDDCKSDNLFKIKLLGILAAIAGLLHIANGVVCLMFLAPEERSDPENEQPSTSNPRANRNSEPKPSTSNASSYK